MMMVMMMVVMTAGMVMGNMALSCIAGLTLRLKFQRTMDDSVLLQFLPHRRFQGGRLPVCNDMHCSVVILSVYAPDMNMVHIQNTLNMAKVVLNFLRIHAMGHFFQEQIQNLL